jgi:hypothetical protein
MSENVRLNNDSKLAVALACGESTVDAANQVGVSDRTVRRKMADPEFRRQVAELRAELMSRALDRIANSMTRAAEVLDKLLDSDKDFVQLRAARSLLVLGQRLRDSVDLNDRMRQVEEDLARKTGGVP